MIDYKRNEIQADPLDRPSKIVREEEIPYYEMRWPNLSPNKSHMVPEGLERNEVI
jgi:hypothetical protein